MEKARLEPLVISKQYIFRKISTACDNRTTVPPTDDKRTTRTARANKDY
jgi:hypothetical protein